MEQEQIDYSLLKNITEAEIVESIKACLTISSLIKPSKTLVSSTFNILKSLLLQDKKYVIIEAPTGSGKTIIGFMIHFCIQYLYIKKAYAENGYTDFDITNPRVEPLPALTYTLTSNKMLQAQIDNDLDRFDFRDYIFMLQGIDNYDCLPETEEVQAYYKKYGKYKVSKEGKELKRVSYADRPCKGMDAEARQKNFPDCTDICPYRSARIQAAGSSCTILNYAYFLNVMRGGFNPFFSERFLTISDEAHLIPDIVCNIFNFEFTQYANNQLFKLIQEIEMNYGDAIDVNIRLLKNDITDNFILFRDDYSKKNDISDLIIMGNLVGGYFVKLESILESLKCLKRNEKLSLYHKQIDTNIERVEESLKNKEPFEELYANRKEDMFCESELVSTDGVTGAKIYKHFIKDLSEPAMVKRNFLSKLNKAVFMSATLGDIDEYAIMMGMDSDEYTGLRLNSTFDFSESPIFICKSGYLNFNNFNSNIDKVLMDAIKICNTLHPTEKGIIHTSTHRIGQLLKDKVFQGLVPDKSRFLFYSTSDEKERAIELMKNSQKPYIIVGPSLMEGIDLSGDQGRFNILIKVQYAALTPYIKKKIERVSFWYERNVLEKLVQSIGRTNRFTNDYSKVYLLDSMFDKMIWKVSNTDITNRIKYKTL